MIFNKLRYAIASAVAINFMPPASYAASNTDTFELIQINGSRLQSETIGSSSIISREEIEKLNPASTIDLLKRVPHIDVSESGNAGGLSFVSIRGGEFNFTLVTLDGIAVNDSTNSRGGGFDFNQIAPAAIERIEIYRGGINTIYGGDAIGGVINIVTKDSASASYSLEFGSQEQLNASASNSFAIGETSNVLGLVSTRNKSDGESAKVNAHQILLKGGYENDSFTLGSVIFFNTTDVSSFTEDSGGKLFADPFIAERRDGEQILWGINTQNILTDQHTLNAKLSWLKREEEIDNPGIENGVFSGIPASFVKSIYERFDMDVFVNSEFLKDYSLVVGVNRRLQDAANDGFIDFGFELPVDYAFSQNISAIYAEGQFTNKQFSIELSARYDAPDDFDNETSIRLGLSTAITNNAKLFAVFNQGYKLPSFFALAHPLVGNSSLTPERSDNYELGFQFDHEDSYEFSAVYFRNEFDDLIDFNPELFTNVNRNKIETSGVELDFFANISTSARLVMSARYLDIESQEGVTLRKRPRISGDLRAEFDINNITTSLFVDFRDEIFDSSIPTGNVTLPGYVSFGLSSRVPINENLALTLNFENVLKKRIEDAVGFIHDDLGLRFGLQYQL